jgi:hypothetical protein
MANWRNLVYWIACCGYADCDACASDPIPRPAHRTPATRAAKSAKRTQWQTGENILDVRDLTAVRDAPICGPVAGSSLAPIFSSTELLKNQH